MTLIDRSLKIPVNVVFQRLSHLNGNCAFVLCTFRWNSSIVHSIYRVKIHQMQCISIPIMWY